MRLLPLLLVCSAFSAAAQDLPDSGLPDASVGQGGADRDNEEGDGEGSMCVDSSTCATRLECAAGRCVPKKTTIVGCSAVPALELFALSASLWLARRRRS